MSQGRVRRLSPACLLALAAISLSCPDALSQELSPPDAPRRASAVEGSEVDARLRPEDLKLVSRATAAGTGTGGQQPQAQQQQQGQTTPPLTPGEKMRRSFRRAFLDPGGYASSALSAIIQVREREQPHKSTEDRFADGLSRFAINFGTRSTRVVLGSGVFPILFRQDPRYERAKEGKGALARAFHAAGRVFVTRSDDGRLQPNYSRWAGNLTASALANLWERSTPGRDRVGADATLRRFGLLFLTDALGHIVFNEFLPDIIKAVRR